MIHPEQMPWLLPAPADWRARLKSVRGAAAVSAPDLRALAGYALDASQLTQLGKLVGTQADALAAGGTLRPVRLGIVTSHTIDFVADALPGTALRHGLLLNVIRTDYGQAAQELLDPASRLAGARPDFVLIALDAQALGLADPRFDATAAGAAVDGAIAQIRGLRDGCRRNTGATPILPTLALPAEGLFGSFDARMPGSVRWMLARFNRLLAEEVCAPGDLLLDTAALAETVGLGRWHDPLRWHDAKLPFALDAIPLYADHLCRLLAAARGLSKKCLVLDLDNTLWGGVIGDDGVEGIKLGQGSARGEAHLAVQRLARDLKARGIVLAVCSKNEEAAAKLPFGGHDEMVLGLDDIAVFVANWTDKATNLRAIAQTLNIGVDSLVFLDDNPAERERVRQELPEVGVPEVGDEPSDYVRLLSLAGYFEAVAFGDEDRQRAGMYQANAERQVAMAAIGNLDDYLASLAMECTIQPFDAAGRARIAQLINKSNQFNLTTRRRTEADVAAVEADPASIGLQIRLVDRFGDNGMISVVIFERDATEWRCDTWLMSCRVLGRRVEEAALRHIATAARAAGAERLIGEYRPTAKNKLVERFWERMGFHQVDVRDDGSTVWALELADYAAPDLPMVIVCDINERQSRPVAVLGAGGDDTWLK